MFAGSNQVLWRLWSVMCALTALSPAAAQTIVPHESWVATWGSAQEAPYGNDVLSGDSLAGATLRQVVHMSVGGSRVRVRISNAFGERALGLRSVHVALRGAGRVPGTIDTATSRRLSFGGQSSVSIPMGADYLSDALDYPVAGLSDLVVSIVFDTVPKSVTFHAGARATSFLAPGDHASDVVFASPKAFPQWYFLAGVDIAGANGAGSVVVLGDSITDGHGATTDGNDRWPDVLARRLAGSLKTRSIGVVNMGIGGNRILEDGIATNAMARFDRDVLSVPGVRSVIVLEGINDLGSLDRTEEHPQAIHDALVARLEEGFRQMALRAHAHHLAIYGGTVMAFLGSGYYHPGARAEADRQALNTWIRTSHTFDGVIDFDAVTNDPAQPGHLLAEADSGDHLHPGSVGYRRMGDAIPLGFFAAPAHR